MSAKPCRLRLSPGLRALVDAASPNASAAQRALMLLGVSLVGYDLSGCRADLGRLLGEELDPHVRTAIDALYGYRGPGVGVSPHDRPTASLHVAHQQPTAVPPQGTAEPKAGELLAQIRVVDMEQVVPETPPSFPAEDEASQEPSLPDDDPFASVGIDV